MTIDRSTKLLLTLLVLGVWGLLLRPSVAPARAEEQPPAPEGGYSWSISGDMSGIYVFKGNTIYRYQSNLGKPVATAQIGDLPDKR